MVEREGPEKKQRARRAGDPAGPKADTPSATAPGERRVLSTDPPVYETPLEQVRGLVTPISIFYVRNHFPTPRVDVDAWRLRIEGTAIERALELSYEDILGLPSRSQINWLECAGNGRLFFALFGGRPAPGVQWRSGGVSAGEWTGVPLAEVLARAGVKTGAVDVLLEGLDEGRVGRPIPLSVAMDPATILAYGLNGEPLPADHGFPLRAIIPGWASIACIKWLGRIVVEDRPVKTRYNTEDYVMKGPEHPGSPPITRQNIKSVVALPWGSTLPAGRHTIRGFAWSADGRISRVEYSLDGGKAWAQARLAEPNMPFLWVRWEFVWQAAPGEHTITTRATDEKGSTQPDRAVWNEQGYLYNAAVPHPVKVV